MLSALESLKGLIKTRSYHIDYPLFRLHYQVTVCLLLAFSLILTAKVLFGDTIDCKGKIEKRDAYYDNMCYSQGTFTRYAVDAEDLINIANTHRHQNHHPSDAPSSESVENQASEFISSPKATIDEERAQPKLPPTFPFNILSGTGMGDYLKTQFRLVHRIMRNENMRLSRQIEYIYTGIIIPRLTEEPFSTTYWHRYYQYIPIILFVQAVFFYLPHYLWKIWENGIVGSICKRLHDHRFTPTEYIESNYHIIDYLQNCFALNKSLVYKYYACHLLLLLNLIGQIIFLNAVFNNQFVTYGMDVFYHMFIDSDIYGLSSNGGDNLDVADLNNPMDYVFPKVTACTVKELGQGDVNELKLICVLPLNILHDKFFLLIWFWFLALGVITILQVIFDALYISMPMVRKYMFNRRFGPYLSEDNRHSSSLPELFLLDLIGSNSDKFAFSALLRKLNKEDWRSGSSSDTSVVI